MSSCNSSFQLLDIDYRRPESAKNFVQHSMRQKTPIEIDIGPQVSENPKVKVSRFSQIFVNTLREGMKIQIRPQKLFLPKVQKSILLRYYWVQE